ncbi:MAG: M4 family metallopeptidase [Holophaga sp.]|nr:M4 family metallopeptidase [Holophaga sp.]
MSHFRPLFLYLALALPCSFLRGADDHPEPDPGAARDVLQRLLDRRAELGLREADDFKVKDVAADPNGALHVRLQQRYRGLRVWGGEAIVHLDAKGAEQPMTDALVRGIQVEVTPNLDQAEALAITHASEAPRGSYARAPTVELLVYPDAALQPLPEAQGGRNARDFAPRVTRLHLAYHIHLDLQNGAPETRNDDFLVDAHTGAILRRWSTLFTVRKPKGSPATTLGHSQYSGEVKLGTLSTSCGFVMADPTRATISTRDLAGRTEGHGVLYVSQEGRWGDGENYDPLRGSKSPNGQTAAVDAHYGLQTTWDFYRNVLGRNGIDGKGRTAYNRVHYASGFDNAFWDDDCFCMTYGDGETFKTLTALDVVAHEVSHGLCHSTADLDYQGESGGLNEASSDIFGVMVYLYGHAAHGKGPGLPAKGGRWTMGDDLKTAAFPNPLRYMFKPSLDGFSPDAWSPDLDYLDVHLSSGPMNRAFYFLSQGASARKSDDAYSAFLPKGMRGIGNDKALRIWWRTLSTYLTPKSRYQEARQGSIRAAGDLFGEKGPEVKAVRLAFHGINVDGPKNATIRTD